MDKVNIVYKGIGEIIPYINNPRINNEKAVDAVASSIKNFGFKVPIVIDVDNEIINGHTRLLAAKKLGLTEVPCIVATDLTDAQIKAFRIADNKVSEFSEWDNELLESELAELQDMDFDVDLTGFNLDDFKIDEPTEVKEDDYEEELPIEPTSKRGDIWLLGNHRLMCGDSTSIKDIDTLMDGVEVDMLFTDPPYGISIVRKDGHIAGKGNLAKANTYRPIVGDEEYFDVGFLLNIGKKQLIWGANYFHNILPLGTRWIVWDKNRPAGTTFSDCELAWTNIEGVAVKKYECTWNGMIKEGESGKRVHPTQKPLKLCGDILSDLSSEEDNVLDLFGGSVSTLIACEQLDRICYMMELDEKYVDVIVDRYVKYKGDTEDIYLIRDGNKLAYTEVQTV